MATWVTDRRVWAALTTRVVDVVGAAWAGVPVRAVAAAARAVATAAAAVRGRTAFWACVVDSSEQAWVAALLTDEEVDGGLTVRSVLDRARGDPGGHVPLREDEQDGGGYGRDDGGGHDRVAHSWLLLPM